MFCVGMCTRRHPNTPFFTEPQPELYSVATSEMDSAYHASGNGTVKVVQTQRAPPSWSPTACDTWNLAGLISARIRPRIDRWHVDDQLLFGRRIDGVHVCPKVACRADSADSQFPPCPERAGLRYHSTLCLCLRRLRQRPVRVAVESCTPTRRSFACSRTMPAKLRFIHETGRYIYCRHLRL